MFTVEKLKDKFLSLLSGLQTSPFGLGNQIGAVFALLALKRLCDWGEADPCKNVIFKRPDNWTWSFKEFRNNIVHQGSYRGGFIGAAIEENSFLQGLPTMLSTLSYADLDVIETISNLDFSNNNLMTEDIFGKIYSDSLLVFFESDRNEFTTPVGLSALLIELANIESGTSVYDPCAGLGGTLVNTQSNSKKRSNTNVQNLFGQEISTEVAVLANLHLAVNGIQPNVATGDVLSEPAFTVGSKKIRKFERIVSQLPMGLRLKREQVEKKDLFGRYGEKFNSRTLHADRYFMQHIVHSLSEQGRAAFSLSPSFCWIKGAEKHLRKHLVDNDLIEAILQLPHRISDQTHIAPVVFVLTKKKPASRSGKVLFVDCQRQYSSKTRGVKTLTDKNIEFIKSALEKFETTDFITRVVSKEEIAKNSYNLNSRLYVDDSEEANKVRNLIKQHENYQLLYLSDPTVSEEITESNTCAAKNEENVVYFPSLRTGAVSLSHENLENAHQTRRRQRVFKIKLNPQKISAKYAVQFYGSELGRAILNSMSKSSLQPVIGLEEIKSCIVAIPPIEIQEELVKAHDNLQQLSEVLSRFSHDISLNPEGASEVLSKTQEMMLAINELSDVDKVLGLVRNGESKTVEFKQTLRLNLRTREKDPRIEKSIIKTIAAFLNSDGGTLLVGVNDEGQLPGVEGEIEFFKWNFDKFLLHFKNLLQSKLGETCYPFVDQKLIRIKNRKIFSITCTPADKEVFVEDTEFYVRTNPATDLLEGRRLTEYIRLRFG